MIFLLNSTDSSSSGRRYVEFETAHGDSAAVDRAKRKALDYVEAKLGVAAAGDGDA